MEEPYGFFGVLNPTGHNAVYFARICAETPYKVRRCQPGELGSVLARYEGMAHHDWAAIPLVPYLYSVNHLADVPVSATGAQVQQIRSEYHQNFMEELGPLVRPGNIVRGGWKHLIGVAYDRRVFAYRFETTEAQDDAMIAMLNTRPNVSYFNLFYWNCADFVRLVLNQYFPKTFRRALFPDLGMGTPKQMTSKFIRFAKKHPELKLTAFEIPQIPGFRRASRSNKGIIESLVTTSYVVPVAFLNPYLAGGLLVDFLVHGRFRLHRRQPTLLSPDRLSAFAGNLPFPLELAPPEATQDAKLAPPPELSPPAEPATATRAPSDPEPAKGNQHE